jgi:hypothetical protein
MHSSMAARASSRKRRVGLTLAAWLTVILGAYGVVAVASIWGIVTGGIAGAMGTLIAVAVLTDHPQRRARRVARVGLVLSGIALAVCVAVLVAIVLSEL